MSASHPLPTPLKDPRCQKPNFDTKAAKSLSIMALRKQEARRGNSV